MHNWEEYEASRTQQLPLFPGARRPDVEAIVDSRGALASGNVKFFVERLPASEYYRIALSFPRETLFADIETTGLSLYYDYITMVGWELNGRYDAFLRGSDQTRMHTAFERAKVIVTFNGSRFDLPFLRKEFPDLSLPACHIDLRFFVRRAGVSGGQKEVEERLGLTRDISLKGIAGEAAPVLWHRYRWGDTKSLRLLVSYNHADVDGLKGMLDIAISETLRNSSSPVNVADVPKFSASRTKPRFIRKPSKSGILLAPFIGDTAPPVSWKDLNVPEDFTVVGIDLTGSEARPSGWCAIHNGNAVTVRIGSDDELLGRTLDAGAGIVSIDSPLSLPFGRQSVEDTDPTRDEYGITRECERILRQRGINVYPCLLPSMQRLTARGIRLATRFRQLGIPVIESYPGAAQDILGIPRKRASLELLSRGLAAFGIGGTFHDTSVSHDELDAITSAIVGLFFWGGRFEALGNETEEYLIIPEIASGEQRWREHLAVGLSGPIGAGKTTAGQHLRDRGFTYARYSQVIDAIAAERGLEPTRDVKQFIGLEINRHGGQRRLGRSLLASLAGSPRVVIDGMRHPEDHAFLIEAFGPHFHHITLDAPLQTRLQRAMHSGIAATDFTNALSHPVEANVPKLAGLAKHRIDNTGSIAELISALDQIVFGSESSKSNAA